MVSLREKRQIKRIAQLIIAFCFIAIALGACGEGDEEIFKNTDDQLVEQATDEEDEKKSTPGG